MGSNDDIVIASLVAACSQANILALSPKVGRIKASLGIDTGASVNVLSEKAYLALKRASRGNRWPLRPNDLNLTGVTSDPLNILGIVSLPIYLGKGTSTLKLDFYVASNFTLPSDGLLGLTSMRANRMVIYPEHGTVKFQGKSFRAMDQPMPIASEWERKLRCMVGSQEAQAVCTIPATSPRSTPVQTKQNNLNTPNGKWKVVNATVIGDHEIPDRVAMHIPVSVPKATVGCDICLEGPSRVKRLVVESTLNTVREGHRSAALVVNTTGSPIKLKQGVFLSEALAYDKPVVSEPLEMPANHVASLHPGSNDNKQAEIQNLDSFVTTSDYPELRPSLLKLLKKYREVIALPGESLGVTDRSQHHIKLKPGTQPVYVPAYRLPHAQRQVVTDAIEEMLEEGVIQNSKSPWNSPLFLVPKKDGKYRPVIDFRKVNEVTEDDRYPLPVLSDLLMSLGRGNRIYSSLDLLSGYWQVPMAPMSREVTAFSTPRGHFEWLRMPFGLKSAPITFQRMINTLFSDMLGKNVHAYLDDVIVCNTDPESHFKSLEAVLLKLKEAGLKAKVSKCEFLKEKITFLGHCVDVDGIHTMEDKIFAINKFPQPQNVDNVRSFLGLCGYYRSFIKGFATLASPLTKLLKKEVPFHWNTAQEASFQNLKHALTNAPVLAFPNYEDPFVLYTDASGLGLGAVLMQPDACGKNRAIAFASRTLNPAESNYSVTHQETLAVVWALKKFRDIIHGYPITVYTDHAAVTELFKGRNLHGKLARWFLTVQEYQPTFKHLPGRANVVADALSRNVPVGMVMEDSSTPVTKNFTIHDLANAQRQHDVWKKVIYALESGDETNLPNLPIPFSQFFVSQDGVLCRYWPQKTDPIPQFVIPESYIPRVLELVHDMVIAGHPGKERTLSAARKSYFWPTMRKDIDAYVTGCVNCAQHKGSLPKTAPILEYPPPERPWDVVGIDILQLPASHQGSKYLMVCVDHFSRYIVLAPLQNKTASAVAHALIGKLICPYSAPRVLLSDNGAEFRNSLLAEICKQFSIYKTFTVTYHPASNGLVERANRKVLEVLRPAVSGLLENWEDWLPQVAASINGSPCESTGQTPHFIVFGMEKRLPYDLLSSPQNPVYNVDDYAKQQLRVFSNIHQQVQNRLRESKAAMSSQQHRRSSPVTLKVGDTVMMKVPERNSKLSPNFVGPRLVVREVSQNKFELLDPVLNTLDVVHVDRLKKVNANTDLSLVEAAKRCDTTRLDTTNSNSNTKPSHSYNLRSQR